MRKPKNHESLRILKPATQFDPALEEWAQCRYVRVGKKSYVWSDLLEGLEKKIVEGQHLDVRESLDSLDLNSVPREFAARLAELASRSGRDLTTLKILNTYVFPKNELAETPSDREKFIYAMGLSNVGAVQEAITIFDSIDEKAMPEVLLRKALAQFRIWNYKEAILNLQNFLTAKAVTPYQHLIGKVNLAAALIVEGSYDQGEQLLAEIQEECRRQNYLLLLGNTYEMLGQIHFFRQKFDEGLTALNESHALLKAQGGEFLLYTEKWQTLCHAFQNRREVSVALSSVQALREKSLALCHWETVRECDLFLAILSENEDLCRQVIFGTPFEFYRQRARRLFGKNLLSQGTLHLQLGDTTSTCVQSFSPFETQKGGESLHGKPQLLMLFQALTLDFYRPSHIGLLFQRIYKDEAFNPFSSPARVLSLMKRLNQWFSDQQVPLKVRMKKSEFSLTAVDGASVQVLIHRAQTLTKQSGHLKTLKALFKDKTFSAQLVADKMKISKTSAQSLLGQAIDEGAILKIGTGRGTSYVFASKSRKKLVA